MRNSGISPRWALACLFLLAGIAALSRGESPPTSPATAPATAPSTNAAAEFGGEWLTSYGPMTLVQTGKSIKGAYGPPNGRAAIEGTLDATGRFNFTYTEPTATGEGWFELAAGGQRFAGQWREKEKKAWQPWEGRRLGAGIAGVRGPAFNKDHFTGLWQTAFGKMRLHQDGNKVEGIYEFAGRSTITGTIDSRTLKFRYDQPDGEKGSGTFNLAADGLSFTGTWQGGKDKQPAVSGVERTGGGAWEGRRILPQAGKQWLIILEAPWEQGLNENEYSFGQMLRTYFARVPTVTVRHRILNTEADFRRWTRDVPYLAEPVVLYISSHGTEGGITVGGKTIGAKTIAECVQDADNLMLLHFGSCLVCAGDVPKEIRKTLGTRATYPISGFTKMVDWAGSALCDFTYLELIFSRHMSPADAVKQTHKMLSFANDAGKNGDAIPPVGLMILEP
jgi:hypothetical protein